MEERAAGEDMGQTWGETTLPSNLPSLCATPFLSPRLGLERALQELLDFEKGYGAQLNLERAHASAWRSSRLTADPPSVPSRPAARPQSAGPGRSSGLRRSSSAANLLVSSKLQVGGGLS